MWAESQVDRGADAEMAIRALRRGNIQNKLLRVRDGVEALEFIFRTGNFSSRRGANPRLMLLDLKMPRIGGIDVLRRLKADDSVRLIPVVMFTSSAEHQDIADSYRLGVNSYLVKPVDFPTFNEVLCEAGRYWGSVNQAPN